MMWNNCLLCVTPKAIKATKCKDNLKETVSLFFRPLWYSAFLHLVAELCSLCHHQTFLWSSIGSKTQRRHWRRSNLKNFTPDLQHCANSKSLHLWMISKHLGTGIICAWGVADLGWHRNVLLFHAWIAVKKMMITVMLPWQCLKPVGNYSVRSSY